MTGVHWLLAHCSVLKVRAESCRFRTSGDTRRPPAAADGPWRNPSVISVTSGSLLTLFHCQKAGSHSGPFPRGASPEATPMVRRPLTERQQAELRGDEPNELAPPYLNHPSYQRIRLQLQRGIGHLLTVDP